jgi:hypothetical protein
MVKQLAMEKIGTDIGLECKSGHQRLLAKRRRERSSPAVSATSMRRGQH